MTIRRELSAVERGAIDRGVFVKVPLGGPMDLGEVMPTTALVGRDADGTLRAYANVCRHRAIPLDLGAPSAMSSDGVHLLCHQHGAIYRTSDGMCIAGPCAGARLVAIAVREAEDGAILLGAPA